MNNAAINIRDLTLSYDEKNVIANLDCLIPKHRVTTIIGPNGAGKSTLLKSIARLLHKQSGDIYIMEKNAATISRKALARLVAVLLQQNTCPADITVEKLIYMGRMPHKKWFEMRNPEDETVVREAMHRTGITDMRDKRVLELSGGERQRVWMAMAIAQKTDILLLDEPTTYLDISFQMDILELVREINRKTNITIVMVLHDLNHAFRYSDEILVLKDGQIVRNGAPEEIVNRDLLREVYNIEAEIIDLDGKPYIIAKNKWR
ncbi:MAG: ABC transporter ATP-binding protein [Eubacteriales bacterium]|nr:ABC transporter ATP-binding protein [Eubacteriales bacterium]